MPRNLLRFIVAVLSAGLIHPIAAQVPQVWNQPFPAFRIAGNLYYVGTEDLAAYLIVTPKGDILINSDLTTSVPLIRKSVESLGFHFRDIRILLISHGHYDHCAGSARIKQLTGAKYEVMEGDVSVVESGGRTDFRFAHDRTMWFPPTHVDRVLHDGGTVELGGMVLTAHITAGHTKGATTWTFDEREAGRLLHVVIVGGPFVLQSYRLVGNKAYPQIASDYQHGFDAMKRLPCDIFLGAHGSYFGLREKYERWKAGDRAAFIDPTGYQSHVAEWEQDFHSALRRQQQVAR
ncbi:MAG TPA: subclass B3 metallo-beta-lactamase [Terracidiphilus sp.]|nr:subclass B3 metallo-beta-lactamase [Terracidiphilus sp.]